MDADWQIWVSIAAAAAAWAAVPAAFYAAHLARRGLDIEAAREKRHEPRLSISVTDSFCRADHHDGTRLYGFALLVANASASSNAIMSAELHVNYELAVGQVVHAVLMPIEADTGKETKTLVLPLTVPPNAAESGWLFFQMDGTTAREHRIRDYSVVLVDAHGTASDARIIIVRELMDAPEA